MFFFSLRELKVLAVCLTEDRMVQLRGKKKERLKEESGNLRRAISLSLSLFLSLGELFGLMAHTVEWLSVLDELEGKRSKEGNTKPKAK